MLLRAELSENSSLISLPDGHGWSHFTNGVGEYTDVLDTDIYSIIRAKGEIVVRHECGSSEEHSRLWNLIALGKVRHEIITGF